MAVIDLSRLPPPQIVDVPDFETLLAERKASFVALYPVDEQDAVRRTLALDTLNELAAAMGNDPNFTTTVMNALSGKQPPDATLTNLSGKSISGLLEYLGFQKRQNNVGHC